MGIDLLSGDHGMTSGDRGGRDVCGAGGGQGCLKVVG